MIMSRSFDIICGYIKHRINIEDKSQMLLIVGEMGSGKSLAAVSIACKIDPSFDVCPRIVYTVPDFLDTLIKMKKGQCIIFDEAGVGVPAREWQHAQNKIMSIITQILRYKNVCCIFTTPNIRLLDINVREAMNGFIKPRYIDTKHNVNVCKYKIIMVNDDGVVVKRDFIYYDGKSGAAGEIIDPLYIPRPNQEIEEHYKKISIEMKNAKLKELKHSIDSEAPLHQSTLKSIENKAEACVKMLNYFKKTHTWDELATASGMSRKQENSYMG
ncbi:MAG: hypothetical protein WBL02_03380 [Methanomethylovorans sp.]